MEQNELMNGGIFQTNGKNRFALVTYSIKFSPLIH